MAFQDDINDNRPILSTVDLEEEGTRVMSNELLEVDLEDADLEQDEYESKDGDEDDNEDQYQYYDEDENDNEDF